MKHVTFLYGTETGVSEEFCFLVASIAANNGVRVSVLPIDELPITKWGVEVFSDSDPLCDNMHSTTSNSSLGAPDISATQNNIINTTDKTTYILEESTEEFPSLVFFISTAGQGEMPMTMKKTWERLRLSDAPTFSSNCRFAVFGLGDSTYSKFNYAAKMFHNRMQQLGATPIVHRGLGDERDGKGIWQELEPWLEQLWKGLGIIISDPSLIIDKTRYCVADAYIRSDSTDAICAGETPGLSTAVGSFGHRPNCKDFAVKKNTRLTSASHFQHVSYVEFRNTVDKNSSDELEKAPYQPGDCLALYPSNSLSEVRRILKALHITELDATSRQIIVTHNTSGWPNMTQQPKQCFLDRPISVWELLTRFIDLEGIVSQTFLRMFSACAASTTDDTELVERMRDLGTPKNCEDYNSFAYREKRTMSEVMEDFPRVIVTLEQLISNAPLMRPRYYSISSSPSMDGADLVGVTVALFQIKTPLGRDRTGLCSRWICKSSVGDSIEGFIFKRPFIIDSRAPLILIGPGTGVAPLRSIIRERVAVASGLGSSPPEMILFFGCRNKDGDFLHGEEWGAFSPFLRVVTAFSRDGDGSKKEYVQHKLIDDSVAATKVYKLLTTTDEAHGGGAVVIICGNAKHMPNSVQDALASILAAGGCTKDEGLAEVNRMRIKGRIKFETWSV